MSVSAPSICAHAGCVALTPSGARYCTAHVREARTAKIAARRDYNATRGSAAERGYDARWQVASRNFLAANPQCRACGRLAQCTDHITPHRGDNHLFWDAANWQPLCHRCHNSKTARGA